MKHGMLLISLLACTMGAQAAVYKWVDEDGNVHFSDEPGHPDAEKIHVAPPSTYTPPPLPPTQQRPEPPSVDQGYSSVQITAPPDGTTIRSNQGEFSVNAQLEPSLRTALGHNIGFYLDGKLIHQGAAASYVYQNVDRGSHQVAIKVLDRNGKVVAGSSAVTIYMHRFSQLQNPPPPANGTTPNTPRVPTAPAAPTAPKAPRL